MSRKPKREAVSLATNQEKATPDSRSAREISERLLVWYRRHRRSLPWRETRDPYCIWVSEIMLQQTRVATVIPYYHRFLERFPDVAALADAPEPNLLEAWSGLGYYRRARQMQQAAKTIVADHGGNFPASYAGLLALPGIGSYTAAAVASIAFGKPHAVVDGNVIRVLTRLFDDAREVTRPETRADLAARAQQLLERAGKRSCGQFNQALMELGATLCTPRNPQCLLCPLAQHCLARRRGTELDRPNKKPKEKLQRLELIVALVRRGKSLLMRQRPSDETIMPGFWELPQAEGAPLDRDCFFELGINCDGLLGEFRHGITFRSYRGKVHRGSFQGRTPEGYRWITESELATLPLTTITRKALAAAGSYS